MSTSVTNGIGAVIAVTTVKQQIDFVTSAEGNTHKSAMTLKVVNTGSNDIYVSVNELEGSFDITKAVPIAADKDFWFVGQPIKRMNIATLSGESTATYGAY